MSKLGHKPTISNTKSLLGQIGPWVKRAPGNRGECAPPLNLTQIYLLNLP